MQTDDLFAKKLQALNGNMGPPGANTQGTPAVPKMGVRARVSDWPQKKDGHGPPPRYESLMTTFQNGQPNQLPEDVVKQSPGSPPNPSFLEAKYGLGELLSQSPGKVHHALQKRSNSDVTISDIGAEDMDQTAINPNTGATLHREYGSTSSINRQGVPDEGFFGNLKVFQPELSEQPSAPPPHGFPEFRRYEAAISPSLQTAAQIARGDIVCIPNYSDYVDSSLFYSREREKSFLQRQKSEKGETSIFRRLKTMKSEQRQLSEHDDCSRHGRPLSFQRCFAHYDVQSVLFNISEAVTNRANLARRKNITTGASAASQHQIGGGLDSPDPLSICEPPLESCEELAQKANMDPDEGDGKSNGLVLSCPYFRNEIGGEGERKLSATKPNSGPHNNVGDIYTIESTLSSHCTNAGVSVLEMARENYASRENYAVPRDCIKRYIIEHIDMGAYYYHKFFFNKEHQNYFGVDENLGPVSVSIRREKLEEGKEGPQYNYRVVFRTSELTTLRGSILEDAVPSTAKHGTSRGLPLKEVLEYVVPEVNIQCLRLATTSPKVPEQLLKLDQQGLSYQHKVGILYCQAGQSTEEEMYNNESGSPALEEFLDLLGQKVRLKGFNKYRAQLDNKTDSTGTHSLYTTYKDFELMFHVSTMLPYTPNNRQQLLRKRHIGNDIVTIIFQEPGAFPFTPQNIRSHFQHVFIIVKVHNPCTEHVCYSVAVARSKDVPVFGPPIPKGVMFPKSAVFRDFLLAKVINGENAAHKSEKFRAMATRTRQEYLKELVENFTGATPVDASGAKFSFITLGAKRKERSRPRNNAHLYSTGAITWSVVARDSCQSTDIGCLLAISRDFVALIEEASREVVFNCYCKDVIGWSSSSMVGRVKLFYERGDCVVFSVQDGCPEEVREVVQRLEMITRGCEALEMTLRRNALGQLGFHVNFEGVVADVEPFGFAWQAGLRPGCRLLEICKVAVGTLTHEQMIDYLRTSTPVTVVVIQPHEDGTPRSADAASVTSSVSEQEFLLAYLGASELYRVPVVEYKTLGTGPGWHRMTHVPQALPLSRVSPTQGPDRPSPSQQMFQYAQAAISRSTSFDKKYQDGSRVLQDFEMVQSPSGNPGQHYCSSPSNQSTSSDPGPCGTWAQKASYDGSQSPALHDQPEEKEGDRDHKLERTRSAGSPCVPEAKWHIPSTKILNRGLQRQGAKESPGKFPRTREKSCHSHCSSHSSNNTLSSNASSGSDEKHFGSGDPMDPESLGLTYIKGASTDSGIDTAPCMPPPPPALPLTAVGPSRMVTRDGRVETGLPWPLEYHEDGETDEGRAKMFISQGYVPATPTGHTTDGSTGDLSEISSLSR
ncbi:signal-induced proliferation-associated 1 2 isoform X1 [Labeo rohita]|uniref:Signal-induced proliferation-associated 1 2 isoform X1 n=1 Tax=Labeo rohita TaxID=84645 RepID=A0A498NPP2_LABRO|nr:signal-induced proliferation-associated 1 2 isoform X1 [Labeo rohita]